MTQKTPAQLRADAEATLKAPGQRRIKLLAQLDELDTELRPLIMAAREVELPNSEDHGTHVGLAEHGEGVDPGRVMKRQVSGVSVVPDEPGRDHPASRAHA